MTFLTQRTELPNSWPEPQPEDRMSKALPAELCDWSKETMRTLRNYYILGMGHELNC